MDVTLVLTILGTLGSIIGAIIAIHQARQSKKSADKAEKVRSQLIHHRKTSELTKLETVCRKAQKSMEKYGPAATDISLEGISDGAGAEDVQEFILLLHESASLFGSTNSKEIDSHFSNLKISLENFVSSHSSDDIKKRGSDVLFKLNTMLAYIKNSLDAKREHTI